jgi:hypothetical protein
VEARGGAGDAAASLSGDRLMRAVATRVRVLGCRVERRR